VSCWPGTPVDSFLCHVANMSANMSVTCRPDRHMSVVLTLVLTCQHLPAKEGGGGGGCGCKGGDGLVVIFCRDGGGGRGGSLGVGVGSGRYVICGCGGDSDHKCGCKGCGNGCEGNIWWWHSP
jgi:hypothetical protein